MSDTHHRFWADLKQPLGRLSRELTCRLVPALKNDPDSVAPRYLRRPPSKSFSEYEPQHYLQILTWRKPSNDPAAPPSVLPEESRYESLRSMARYLRDLRNKYDHENTVTAEEQLADCLVMLRFVGRSKHLLPDDTFARDVEGLLLTHLPRLLSILIENRRLRLPDEEVSSSPAPLPAVASTKAVDRTRTAPLVVVEQKLDALVSFAMEASRYADELRKDNAQLRALLVSIDARQLTLSEQIAERPPKEESIGAEGNDSGDGNTMDELMDCPPLLDHELSSGLSLEEARDLLISLRWQIWEELGTGPSADGILRKRMMHYFLTNRITTEAALRSTVPARELEATARSHLRYLPEIFAIVCRLR